MAVGTSHFESWTDEPVDPVAEQIRRFTPNKLDPRTRSAIGPVVREAVAACQPATTDRAQTLSTTTTQFVAWAHSIGLDLREEVLFDPDTIDRWIVEGLDHLADGSRANYRSHLRAVGRALRGTEHFPPPALATHTSDPSLPYQPAELSSLRTLVRGLPTAQQRAGCLALLALCGGAGLTAAEVNGVTASHIEQTADGLAVRVINERKRLVPVHVDFEALLSHVVTASGGERLFLPKQTNTTARRISRFQERLPRTDAPKLSTQRLRVTWIVGHLRRGVPLQVVADAAGVDPLQIAKYLTHVDPLPDDERHRLLRGATS